MVFLILAGLFAVSASAQPNRLIAVDDWKSDLVGRLVERGYLPGLDPAALPYAAGDVLAELRTIDRSELKGPEARWAAQLLEALDNKPGGGAAGYAGIEPELGGRTANNRRLDVLRQEGRSIRAWSQIGLRMFVDSDFAVAQIGLRHDLYHIHDPDGLDAGKRWMVRNEESYAGVRYRGFSAYLGRFTIRWAPYRKTSVLLSGNAEPYDALAVGLTAGRWSFRSVYGMLDSAELDGAYNGRAGDRSSGPDAFGELRGSIKRLLVANRLSWRPYAGFQLVYVQSLLATSDTRVPVPGPLFPFLNRVVSSTSEEEHRYLNLLLGTQIWWRHSDFLLFAELSIDNLDSGTPLLGTSAALAYHLRPHVRMDADLEWLPSGLYSGTDPATDFVYLLRGLGTPYADYLRLTLGFDVFREPDGLPIDVRTYVAWLKQGREGVIAGGPGQVTPPVSSGSDESTLRIALEIQRRIGVWAYISADIGMNTTHYQDAGVQRSTRLVGILRVSARLPFTHVRTGPI